MLTCVAFIQSVWSCIVTSKLGIFCNPIESAASEMQSFTSLHTEKMEVMIIWEVGERENKVNKYKSEV